MLTIDAPGFRTDSVQGFMDELRSQGVTNGFFEEARDPRVVHAMLEVAMRLRPNEGHSDFMNPLKLIPGGRKRSRQRKVANA